MPVLPVQLYEAAFNLALFAALVVYFRRKPRAGSVGALYLVTYPVARFILELLRGDERLRVLGLTVAQAGSVALFTAGIVGWWSISRRARSDVHRSA